ncbi:hypothetical protein [Pseudoalteromonas byunsanensis]
MEVPHSVGLGVGGDNVEYVWFGHLCDQDLVSSVQTLLSFICGCLE